MTRYLALAFCLTTLAVAQNSQRQVRYIMGAPCEIEIYSARDASASMDATFAELHRIDGLLSNWNPDSALMKLNHAAGAPGEPRPWVTVAPELFERVQAALRVAGATGGRFDPTVGPLVRVYGFLPSTSDGKRHQRLMEEARSRVGWSKIRLDSNHQAMQFAVPDMEIDLGGIAKGYAAGRAAQVLREQGITSALVSLGGSSITAVGTPPGQAGWSLSIRDPRDGSSSAATVLLHDGEAIATSGTYQNTKGVGKTRRSHIIDPRTGRAIAGLTGVTVLSTDAEAADALTKPFFLEPCCSAADWAKWLASFENASIMLLQARRGELRRITGGAHPERFGSPVLSDGHVAKANRRPAQHLPGDGEGSAGHSAFSSQAGWSEAHRAAGHDPAHVPGDSRTPVH